MMAKRAHRTRTPEEEAAWAARQAHFKRLLERRLERDGMTKEQVMRLIRPPASG